METEIASVKAVVTKAPTYTEKGETTYTVVFENSAFESQTKVLANIDMLTPVTPEEARIVVESKMVNRGKEFTVTVSVKNNPGVMSLMLSPVFSDKLTLMKAENGTLLPDFTEGSKYLWNADEDVTEDGVLMTLTFTTAKDLEPGDYAVDFTLWGSSDSEENDVDYEIVPGVITVTDIIWDDANGDGAVNNKDIVRLKNYLANYNDVTGTSAYEAFPGADANGDGVVNNKDATTLQRYLKYRDVEIY